MNFNLVAFDFPLEGRTGILNHFKINEEREANVEIITDERPFLGMIANLSAHPVQYQVGNYRGTLARHYFNFFSLPQRSCRWIFRRGVNELMLLECQAFLQDVKANATVLADFLEESSHRIVLNADHLSMNAEVLDDVMALLRDTPSPGFRDAMLEVRCRNVVIVSLLRSIDSGERQAAKREEAEIQRMYDYMVNNLDTIADTRILFDMISLPKERMREKFIAMFGQTPQEALKSARIKKAEDLLLYSRLPIHEIALLVGYSSSPHFLHAFHQHHGIYPGEFRKNSSDEK